MKTTVRFCAVVFVAGLASFAPAVHAQLLDHIQKLAPPNNRLPVGDPLLTPTNGTDGPKSIVTADFDGDGKLDLAVANKDGSITVYYGRGDSTFEGPFHLHASTNELRGLVAADLHGAGRADLVVAAPLEGCLHIFRNLGARNWGPPTALTTWAGARDLVSGDFDGDGRADLVVAGSTNGLRQYRGLGGGALLMITNLPNGAVSMLDLTQPAFYLRAFRDPGHTRDELIISHAKFGGTNERLAQVFGANASGALEFHGSITNIEFNALDVGPILSPASNGVPDLIVTDNNVGSVVVYRGVPSLPTRFAPTNEIFLCPGGGPRAVRIADFDGDGWNDVAVVQSSRNHVLVFRNDHGTLTEWQVLATGNKPREMVSGDFNGDGHPDLAVLNRSSQDISILNTGTEGAFTSLDGLYPVDGDVVALEVRDLNNDGHDDVIQLHRSSGLLSVRLAEMNGALRPAMAFSMGALPIGLALYDVNKDGYLDALVSCLGSAVVVRLGVGDGTFGPPITNSMPAQNWGGLYALFPADLDADGFVDLAVHYYDCRLALFRGDGTGHFEFRSVQSFAYESHAITAADFDGDGDLDVVAFGYDNSVVALNNLGDLLTTTSFHKVITKVPGLYGAESARSGDFNHDGHPDLLVSGSQGARILFGRGDLTFDAPDSGILTGVSAASFALADADGDGINDLILGCQGNPCVVVLKGSADGSFTASFQAIVPSSALVASGDLDGDGKPDLVGTGSVLWTALSSRPPISVTAPPPSANTNAVPARVFINEILAANASLPLAADAGRSSDWVEIFSSIAGNTNISGWSLRLEKTNSVSSATNGVTNVVVTVATNNYVFPPGTVLSNGSHLVLVCSGTTTGLFHTGFKLPSEPAVLCLCDTAGNIVDRVNYPAQSDNIAYGRYRDGLPGFTASSNPSPGLPNVDDGPIAPTVSLEGVDGATLTTDTPIHFFARASDDVGVRNVSILWRRLDVADNENHRVILFDDGMNGGDMVFGDGLYSGLLEPGLPPGASIQFYIECTDLGGEVTASPDQPAFALVGQRTTLNSLALGGTRPPIEISELVADNRTGLRDELGGRPDWIEVRNTSTSAVSLAGLQLAGKFFGNGSRYDFGTNRTLAPGEHLVLFADGKTNQGPLHLPFSLDRNGAEVWVTGAATNGARTMIDSVKFGAQASDMAWARLGVGGPWRTAIPTPSAPNISTWAGLVQAEGTFTFGFSTSPNYRFTVEYSDSIESATWTALPSVIGNGAEQSITQPMDAKRFYRVRRN